MKKNLLPLRSTWAYSRFLLGSVLLIFLVSVGLFVFVSVLCLVFNVASVSDLSCLVCPFGNQMSVCTYKRERERE